MFNFFKKDDPKMGTGQYMAGVEGGNNNTKQKQNATSNTQNTIKGEVEYLIQVKVDILIGFQ